MNLIINNWMFLIIIVFVILTLATPRKTSSSMINQYIDQYNNFISEYNSLINELKFMEQEILGNRYKKEDLKEIEKKFEQVGLFTGNISILIGNMKNSLESGKVSSFKKFYRETIENYECLIKTKNTLEILKRRGMSEEEYMENKKWEEKQRSWETEKAAIAKEKTAITFFSGCSTLESIEKRYKSLCKVYHPDVPTGDENTFKEILKEYQQLQQQIKEEKKY